MLKRIVLFSLAVITVLAVPVSAAPIMGLDTAPNAYGSPAWPGFRDAAFASLYAGTFVNQAHSTNPGNIGTLAYEASDYLVTNYGDLGRRLHAFYYVPGETTTTLAAKGFQVSIQYNWDGLWYEAYAGGWVTPTSWINYDGNGDQATDGVMGSMGMAYASYDPAGYAGLLNDIEMYQGNTRFLIRMAGVTGAAPQTYELTATHSPVPEPASLLLFGTGLLGLVRRAQRKK